MNLAELAERNTRQSGEYAGLDFSAEEYANVQMNAGARFAL